MAGEELLIDEFLPEFEQRAYHERHVDAPPRRALDLALAIVNNRQLKTDTALAALQIAPVELGRRENEIVFGGAGRFWRVREELDPIEDAEEFKAYERAGSAKAAINLRAVDADRGSTLSTETRVLSTDKSARRRMRLYWPVIRTAGELMRRELLSATAQAALE